MSNFRFYAVYTLLFAVLLRLTAPGTAFLWVAGLSAGFFVLDALADVVLRRLKR